MTTTWSLEAFLESRGIQATVVRYCPGRLRALWHLHETDLRPGWVQWQLILRYRGRFAGCCLYHATRGECPVVADVLAVALDDYRSGVAYLPDEVTRDDVQLLRCEQIGERLKAFLGPKAFYELLNAAEDGLLGYPDQGVAYPFLRP